MRLDYVVVPDMVKKILYVTHKGKLRDAPPSKHKHVPHEVEFIYADYGSVRLSIGRSSFLLQPGECIVIPGCFYHSVSGDAGTPCDYMNIGFHGKLPAAIFKKKMKVNPWTLHLIERLRQEGMSSQTCCNQAIAGLLMVLMAELLRQATDATPKQLPESQTVGTYSSAYVNRAMKIISDDYAKPLTLKKVSRSSGIGYSRLCKLLKLETGQNFCALLHHHRVAAAKHLLRAGNLSVDEISEAVGYKYASFLFKIFRRISGMTPSEYIHSLGEPELVGGPVGKKKN
jgi:AraC-like DNA-binding protein